MKYFWLPAKLADRRVPRLLKRSGLLLTVLALLGLVCGAISTTAPVKAAAPELPVGFGEINAAAPDAPNASQFLYVDGSGHGITGPLLRFYNMTGGADRHGQPLSEPIRMGSYYLQYFERSALEFYPDYVGTGTEVRFASIGQTAASDKGADTTAITPFMGTDANWYFPESGHSLREPFLSFWRNQGTRPG